MEINGEEKKGKKRETFDLKAMKIWWDLEGKKKVGRFRCSFQWFNCNVKVYEWGNCLII